MTGQPLKLAWLSNWGPPKRVLTSTGPVDRRMAEPPGRALMKAWQTFRKELSSQGLSMWPGDEPGSTVACWEVPAGTVIDSPPDKPAGRPQVDTEIPSYIASQLLPWQPKVVKTLASSLLRYGDALDACGTGVGKTTAALAAFATVGIRNLVVCCPINVIPNWVEWGEKMGVAVQAYNYEKLVLGKTPVLQRTRKTFRWNVGGRTGIVFDEAHRIGGIKSLNARIGQAAAEQGIPTIMDSATLADSPLRMMAPGELLGLFRRDDYWYWAIDHGCFRDPEDFNNWVFSGSTSAMQDIQRSIFGNRKGVKLSPDEIPGFPEVNVQPLLIDVGKDAATIMKLYRSIHETLRSVATGALKDSLEVRNGVTDMAQKIEMLKLNPIIDHLLDAEQEGNSIALFTRFRATAIRASEVMKCGLIIGEQDMTERRHVLAEYQANRSRRMVATIGCGGEAISCHDLDGRFPRYAGLCLDWSSSKVRQAVGRFRRAGAKSKSNIRMCLAYGTDEMDIAHRMTSKLNCLDAMTDQDFCPGRSPDTRALMEAIGRQ